MAEPEPPIEVRRVIAAPIDEVFAAWLDADGMREWMSPMGTASMTADFRPGGAFRLVMLQGDTSIEHTGVFREIDPPYRLVFTWRSDFTAGRDTLVTVELFVRSAEQTEVVLRHELVPEGKAEPHRDGWTAILGRLAEHLPRGDREGA
jgi:uncharacterized protein YndB with AHSA1/START domain